MPAITIRKLIYLISAFVPTVIWFGTALFGLGALSAALSQPLIALIGLVSLVGLVSLTLSFFVIISLPVRSMGGKKISATIMISGLLSLLFILAFGHSAMGLWHLSTALVLIVVSLAVLAELLFAPNNSFQG